MARITGNNMTAKILSVILAAILWIYVMNEQNPPVDSTYTVPLEVRNATEGFMLLDVPESVKVKVRGPRSIVAGTLPNDIKTFIDIKGLKEGRHNLKIYVQAPTSLEVIELNPDKLLLRIDSRLQRQLPVEIRFTGTAVTGNVVAKAVSSVENAVVDGPRSLVETVDKIIAVVDLSNKNADYTASAALTAINRDGKEIEGLTVNPAKANININFGQGPHKKLVDVKPTVYGELAANVSLKRIITDPDKIEISGSLDTLQKTDFIYTEPVNLSGINKDTIKEAKLQLREGLTAVHSNVTVRIFVEPAR